MTAFHAAVNMGYRHLETDARVTADGVVVAFHDARLDRLTNLSGRLSDFGWQQVRHARILDREPVPLLEDVLGTFGEVVINIDVKSHAAIGPTLDAIRRTGSWRRVRLAAFSHSRLLALRSAAGPTVAGSLSPQEIMLLKLSNRRLPYLHGYRQTGYRQTGYRHSDLAAQVPAGVGMLPLVSARFIDNAHALGLPVHVWTINQRSQMIRLLDLGVDAIMTDRADVLRELLIERGQWSG